MKLQPTSARRRVWEGTLLAATLGVLLGLAVLILLGFGEPRVYRVSVFVIVGLVGGVFGILIRSVNFARRRVDVGRRSMTSFSIAQSTRVVLPRFLAGWLAFAVIVATAGVAAQATFALRGAQVLWSLLVFGAIGIVASILLSRYHQSQIELHQNEIRLHAAEAAQRELDLARTLQERLLPPTEFEAPGVRIDARNWPAQHVAGDFYDVIHHPDGSLAIAVADVSGKGMAAGLVMASTKSALPFLAQRRSTSETVFQLNSFLSPRLSKREFVALLFATFQPLTGRLELTNAGLPDPFLLTGDGDVRPLPVPGQRLPLGLRRETSHESLEVQLRPGDRVLFFTDGIPEATAPTGDPLGYDTLSALLTARADSGGAFLDGLFQDVRARSTEELQDDWTATLLTHLPPERV